MPPVLATTEKLNIKQEKMEEAEVRILMFLSVLYYLFSQHRVVFIICQRSVFSIEDSCVATFKLPRGSNDGEDKSNDGEKP